MIFKFNYYCCHYIYMYVMIKNLKISCVCTAMIKTNCWYEFSTY